MSIDTSHNSIPSNIRETLNQDNQTVLLRNQSVAPKNFNEAHGNVLSSMKSLSATRYVKVGDTHGKSGFAALGQILSNIGHNIKALFAGDGSTECKNLDKSICDLEAFANKCAKKKKSLLSSNPDERKPIELSKVEQEKKLLSLLKDDKYKEYGEIILMPAEQENLENLYNQVRNAKMEHLKALEIKNGLAKNERDFLNLATRTDSKCKSVIENSLKTLKNEAKTLLKKHCGNINIENFEQMFLENPKDKNYKEIASKYHAIKFLESGKPFETFAREALLTASGDKEAIETLQATYENLSSFVAKSISEERVLHEFVVSDLPKKANATPTTLADRLETALQKIAKNAGIALN